MIKFARYVFSTLTGFKPYINFMDFGECIGFDVNHYKSVHDFEFKLRDDMVYDVGFDQSTSNTGVIIKNCNNTEVYLLEVSRQKGQDPYQYMFDLELLLDKLTRGSHISHLLYEEPINTKNYRSAQVLFALEGVIQGLPKRYEAFQTAKIDNVPNSTWVKRIKNSRFEDYERKTMTMYSVLELFPWARLYGESIGKDKDIFDAIGVMNGWFRSSYDAQGRPYVKGKEFQGGIGCYLLPNVNSGELCDSFEEHGISSKWAMYNPNLSTYENIAKFAQKDKVAFVTTDDQHAMLNLCVLAGWKFQKMESMCIMIVTPNYMDKRVYEIAGKEFCFVL